MQHRANGAAGDAAGYTVASPFATTDRLSDAGRQESEEYIRAHATCHAETGTLDPSDGGKPGRLEAFAAGSHDGGTPMNGRLPPDVIQRIVRGQYGKFRACYDEGLRRDHNLRGRVAIRFVIGREGTVTNARDSGSDLPDALVVQCIVRAYGDLCFPQPEGGIVTVVYPVMFVPGD
jgi:hypothetical protein